MSEPNEFKAYFTLTGDFEPADITLLIGLQPTEQWRKGDVFGREKNLKRKFSRWSLASRLPKEHFLEEHIMDVLSQLEPVKEKVSILRAQWEPNMATVSFFKENPQGFFFNAKTISALAELNLALDLSLYYEGEGDDANILQ